MNFAALNRLNKFPLTRNPEEEVDNSDPNFDFNSILSAPEGELNLPTSTEVPAWMQGTPQPEPEAAPQAMAAEAPAPSEQEDSTFSPAMLAAISKGKRDAVQDDEVMREAYDASRYSKLANDLTASGNLIGIGMGAAVNKSALTKDNSKPILDAARADADKLPAEAKAKLDASRKAALYDPESAISNSVVAMAKAAGIALPEGITAGQLKDAGIDIDRLLAIKEAAKQRAEAASQRSADKKDLLAEKNQEKKDRYEQQDLQNLSKDISGIQDVTSALTQVEDLLGFKLEEANAKGKDVIVKGKKLDLPGASLPGIGRVSVHSDEAQRLQSAASKIFNTVLKDRSGTAVTSRELENLRTEFAEGKFNTEPQLVAGLQRFKRAIIEKLQNKEAAYKDDVVKKYAEQGGQTSKSIGKPASTPNTKVINGKTYKKVQGGWEEVE